MSRKEIWKDIQGYKGAYKISNHGRIKCLRRKVEGRRGWLNEKIMSLHDTGVYYMISLSKNGIKKENLVHRLVAIHFIPNPHHLPVVNHLKGNTKDNRAWMLEWTTVKGNLDHAKEVLGVVLGGEKHHSAKLNEELVRQIIELGEGGELTHKEISKMFNVTRTNVSLIIKRKIWKHLKIA